MGKKTKFRLFAIAVVLAVVICAVILSGCSKKEVDISSYMSDRRENLFVGECESAYITLTSGRREDPYKFDGVNNTTVDFCIVSIFPSKKLQTQYLDVEIIVGDSIIETTLEKSPYEEGYMADLGSKIASDQQVQVKCGDLEVAVDMTCVSREWEIQCEDALDIGIKTLKETLDNATASNKLKGECYLKIIYDKTREIKTYYWFFSFVGENGVTSSCVIDVDNGQVLAKI